MANNTLIGAIRAEATLESGKFVDGAKKIRLESKKTETQLKSSFGNMGKSVAGFGTALTAGLSIGLLSATIKKGLDYAASLKTISAQAGVTTRDLQTLRYAATQNGLTVAQFDTGLTRLKETMGKVAAGASAPTRAFAALGISAKQLSTLDPAQTFKLLADKLAAIPDPAKRAAFELAIFGESGGKLDPLLSKGSGAINTLTQAAQDLGIVLSDRQIQSADETAAKLDQVKMVLAAQISGVVADNAASIVSLANALGQVTTAVLNFLGSNPTAAVAILGALAGGRIGGLPGAALGGLAGAKIGANMADAQTMGRLTGPSAERRDFIRRNWQEYARQSREYRAAHGGRVNQDLARKMNNSRMAYIRAGGIVAGVNDASAATGSIPQFLAPKGGSPRKSGGGPKGPRDRSDDATYQVQREIMRADMDILRARQALADDYVEQTALSIQMLDLEKQMFEAEQNRRVEKAKQDLSEGRITQAAYDEVVTSVETLKAKYAIEDQLKRQAVLEEEETKRQADYNALDDKDFEIQRDIMQKRAGLAETAGERRQLELELLRLEYEHKRMVLKRIMEESKNWREQEEARRDLANLDSNYALDRQATMNSTRGPLENYLNNLPTSAAKWEEALQQVKVNGLDALTQGIMDTITGVESLGDAFKKVAQQIIADLLRIYIQKTLISALGNMLMPGAGTAASGLGGTLGSVGPIGIGSSIGLPGMARGGSIRVGGRGGIDNNILSINGIPQTRVSYGERIDVSNDNGSSGSPMMPPMHFHFGAGVSERDARRTGMQAATAYRQEMARSSKKGF